MARSQGSRAATAALGAEGFGFANLSPRVHLQAHAQTPNDLAAPRLPFGVTAGTRLRALLSAGAAIN